MVDRKEFRRAIRYATFHILMFLFAVVMVVVTGAAAYRAGVQDGYEQGRNELHCSPIRYTHFTHLSRTGE